MSNRKGLLLAIAIIIMGMFITAGSYAFWSWASGTNKTVTYNTAKNLQNYIIYEVGNSQFSGQFKAVNSYTDGMSSTITISKTSEAANVNLMAIIHMDINQIGDLMKSSPALKWVVTQGNQILGQGNFVGANSGDTLDLVNNIEVTTTPTAYTIWIWLDKNAHPSSALSGETLDTNVWTEITQTAGAEDRFEITRINANYQNISATVVDSKHKVTHYAVVTSGNTPNTWTSIGTASNIYNLNTTVNAAGTYDVYFKDQNNRTTHKSVTVDAVDTTAPSCTFGSFTPVQVSNNETATIDLTCTDNESDITVNNLTTSDITKSNNSINITNITKASITHGYKYTITVTGTENDGDTTLTLAANKIRNAVSLGNAAATSSAIMVANQYTISFVTGNNSCTLDTTTYATKTPTYGDVVNIPAPSCTGYTFAGWTANSGLDTTNAKYGDTNNPTTTWSSTATPVTATYFKDLAKRDIKTVTLTATWTANTYTVRFSDNTNASYAGDTSVPNEYQRIEYIESTGTQYINTQIYPKSTTKVEYAFAQTDISSTCNNGWGSSGSQEAFLWGNGTSVFSTIVSANWSGQTSSISIDTNYHIYYISSGEQRLDNTTFGTSTIGNTATSTQYLYLMAGHTEWSPYVSYYCKQRLYYAKIYDGTSLIRNLLPVYRKSDEVIGLYDTVNNVFYTNAGSGTLKRSPSTKTQSFIYGTSQQLDYNSFIKPGYTFTGWNTQANGSGTSYTNHQQVNNLTSVNNDIIDLYAQWQRNSYTVQVVVNNGTGSDTKNVLYNNTETFMVNNNTGYSNPTITCTNGQTATISGTTLTTGAITNDTVCTVTYTPHTYTVKFNNSIPNEYQRVEYIQNTGTQYINLEHKPGPNTGVEIVYEFIDLTQQQIAYGVRGDDSDATSLSYMMYINSSNKWAYAFKDGTGNWIGTSTGVNTNKHTFRFNADLGYYKIDSGSNTVIASSTRTQTAKVDMYLFAAQTYTGSIVGNSKMKVYSFKIYESGSLVKHFVPVYRKSDNVGGMFDIINNAFYPNIGTDNFTFGSNVDNTISSSNQSFTYGTSQALNENTFTRNGYTFAGWNTSLDGTGTSYNDKQVVGNLTSENNGIVNLYAQWTQNSHTVQIVVNNGTGSTTRTVNHGNTEAFTVGANVGYSRPTVTCTNGQTASLSNTTLTTGHITNDTVCTVTYVVNTYTVRFNYQGYQPVEYIEGTGTQYIDIGYRPGPNTGVYADFQFTDLATQSRLFAARGDDSDSTSLTYTFYINNSSKWAYGFTNGTGNWVNTGVSVNKNRHTLKFNVDKGYWALDNGSNTSITNSTRTQTANVNLHLFADKFLNGTVQSISKLKLYDFKIYETGVEVAHLIPTYRAADEVRGLFDIDNEEFYPNIGGVIGKGADLHSQSFTYGVSQRLDENTYERNGYVFNGWNTSPDGTGTSYSDEQQVENLTAEENGVFNLYAKWLTNDYNIQFISSNELCTLMGSPYANATVGYNDDISVPNPTCAGFNFSGWTSYTVSVGAKSGTTANPTTYWGGASTKNTYFKNLAGRPNATVTMIANWTKTDNTAPTLTVGTSDSGTTYTKSKTATITLSDNVMLAAGTYTIKYGWSTSALTCADMTNTTTITTVTGETSKAVQVTIDSYTGAGRLYVCNPDAISDRVGNTLAADTVASTQMYLDNTGPTGTMTLETNGGVKATLTLTDANVGSMGDTYYYLIDTSPITCDDSTTGYSEASTNNYTFTVYSTGLYYVCAKAEDSLGNVAYFTSSIVVKAYLKTLSGDNDAFKDAIYKTNITDIYFVDNVSIPNDAVATYDLDDTNVGLIKGWIIDNPSTAGKYILYIGSVDPIYGRNLSNLFNGMSGVKSIDFDNFNTSEATTMATMFYGCSNLASLDLSGFDTSNVTTMNGMFGYCSSLISLDLRSFNTSKVTNMQSMFIRCTNLAKVDLSSFDASKVSPATSMFHTCSNLLVIYASPNIWNLRTNITSPGMFTNSTNLAGGNCTLQSSSYVTATRAVIDAPGTAGYLTAPPSSNMLEHGTKGAATTPFLSTNILKNEIKKITFTNSISGHTPNGTDTWDVSYQKNGSVLAWVGTADENGRYEMTIGQNGGVVASNGYYLFSYLTNLASFDGMQYFDTSNVVNMRYMFDGDTSLTSIDLSHFDTLSVKSMTAMFRNCSSLTSLDLSHFNTSNTLHMTSMFDGDSSLTSLNLSSFNTSKVTTMKTMFQNCSNLHSINLSNFDTSNVTDMQAMFAGCSGFAELNLSNFNTSKVTTMQSMFSGCQNLTNLNVKSFNTANVTTMSSMFASCNKLETIDLSSFDTSNVKLMEAVFRYDSNLLAIYVSSDKWSTASVTSSVQMFGSCSSLSGGNGTIFNSSYVTAVRAVVDAPGTAGYLTEKPTSNMLQHGTKGATTTNFLSTNILKNQIKKITFTNSISGHTPNGTDTWDVSLDKNGSVLAWVGSPDGNGRYEMTIGQNGGVVASSGYGLFSYLNNLTAIDGMEYFDTSNVANMYLMFDGDSSLTTINLSNFSTVKATIMRAMFRNCSSLTTLNLSNFDTSKVTNMGAMFDGNTNLTTLNISSFDTSNVTAMDYMFQKCSSLTSISFGNNFVTSNVTTMASMFKGCSNLTTINLSNFNTANVTAMDHMFEECSNLTTLDLSSFNTAKVTTMDSMFNGCNNITNLNVTSFNTSNVTSMANMFLKCSKLTSLNLSNFDTSKVTTMFQMFYGCKNLSAINLRSFNTEKTTNMQWMFYNCINLTYLDLSSFNTTKLSGMSYMFRHCNNVLSIYVSPNTWTTSAISNGAEPFYYDGGGVITNITGGNGTMKNNNYKSYIYARIDADDAPGYLTAAPTVNVLEPGSVKANTSKYLSTNIVKSKIKKITFTNTISGHSANGTDTWDVSFQKNGSVLAWVGTADGNGMYEMTIGQTGGVKALNGFGLFSYLNNLTAIDGMQYFDVSDVTLMRSMFQGDTSLTTLDLSSWDTSKVKLMNNMFNGCSSLTTIYASSLWDTSNLSNSTSMFTGATNLPNFNSSVVDATNAHTGTGGYLTYKAYP